VGEDSKGLEDNLADKAMTMEAREKSSEKLYPNFTMEFIYILYYTRKWMNEYLHNDAARWQWIATRNGALVVHRNSWGWWAAVVSNRSN
jgi:hypothetical protein